MSREFIIPVGIRRPDGTLSDRFPIQKQFRDGAVGADYALFGGDRSSSKTTECLLQIAEDVMTALQMPQPITNPPFSVCLLHEKLEFSYSLVESLFSIFPRFADTPDGEQVRIVEENKQTKRAVIHIPGTEPNRKVLVHWESVGDAKRIHEFSRSNYAFDLIFLDQADLIYNESVFYAIQDRLGRRPIPGKCIRQRALFTANVCHTWVFRRMVRGVIDENESKDQYFFVHANMEDNLAISEDFVRRRRGRSDAMQRAESDWEFVQGLVYGEFDPTVHILRHRDISVKQSWLVHRSIDLGYASHPFACIWGALDQDGNMFILREAERYHAVPQERTEEIISGDVALTEEVALRLQIAPVDTLGMIGRCYGPPDANIESQESGKSIAELMRRDPVTGKSGVYVEPVAIKRVSQLGVEQSGIDNIRQLLVPDPDHRHPITGELNAPHLYISDKCPRLIAQLSGLMYKPFPNNDEVNKEPIQNQFYPQGNEVHHWDLQECLKLLAQQFRLRKRPEEQKPINPAWDRLEAAMHGKPQRGSYAGH